MNRFLIKKQQFRFLSFIVILVLGFILWMLNTILNNDSYYIFELRYLFYSLFIYSIIYICTIIWCKDYDIISPLHLISFIYMFIFFITPILLISNGDTTCYGTDIMNGCKKATNIFLIGYVSFVFAYCLNNSMNRKTKKISRNDIQLEQKDIILASIIIWSIGFIASLLYLGSLGKSPMYILTFGLKGEVSASIYDASNMRFFISVSYMMVIPTIVLFNKLKSFPLKCIIVLMTVSAYYVNGYRFIVLIVLVGCLIISHRSAEKNISIRTMIITMGILIIVVSFMGVTRNDVRLGKKVDTSSFGMNSIIYSLKSNFDIYKPFYGLVNKYPSQYNYTVGGSMLKDTLSMWIPRAIWKNKPTSMEQTEVIALMNSVGDYAIKGAAMAWPNIAEFYMEFGLISVIVCMYAFGYVAKKSIEWYKSDDYKKIIKYSVLLPTFLQLIIRGYTPSNVTMLVFLFLPIIGYRIYKMIFIDQRKE